MQADAHRMTATSWLRFSVLLPIACFSYKGIDRIELSLRMAMYVVVAVSQIAQVAAQDGREGHEG